MDDWEYSDFWCPGCGEQLRRAECPSCGGEGWHDPDELMELDPLWYDEDSWERCTECHGRGYHLWCGNDKCHATKKEIYASAKQQGAGPDRMEPA